MTIPNRAQQIGWGEMNEMKDSKSYQKPIISRNQKNKFRRIQGEFIKYKLRKKYYIFI